MKSFFALASVVLIVLALVAIAVIMTPRGLVAVNHSSQILWGEQPTTAGCNQQSTTEIYVTSIQNATGPSCWGLFLPWSEGGNETSELSFIHQNSNRFNVIVLDDYYFEDAIVKNLSSQNITPIPVLYPYELMNLSGLQSVEPSTKYTILAVSPYDMILFKQHMMNCYTAPCLAGTNNTSLSAWENMISYYSKLVASKSHLILLEYAASPSFWKYPIPTNYTLAMQDEARLQNVVLIIKLSYGA
jgi:hypothetical protein